MRIDKVDIMPVQNSINPELLFEIVLDVRRKYEIPIEITGVISSDENKKIANIHEFMYIPNQSLELAATFRRDEGEEKRTIKLIAPLNSKVLDYIETLRTQNKKGDVILNLDISIRTLESNTVICPLTKDIGVSGGIISEIEKQGNSIIAYRRGDFHPAYSDMWILSGNNGAVFIKTIENNFKNKVTIRSSDWIPLVIG